MSAPLRMIVGTNMTKRRIEYWSQRAPHVRMRSIWAYRVILECGHRTWRRKGKAPKRGARLRCFECVWEAEQRDTMAREGEAK